MVDRYKKSGGFVQLVQVIETCGPKKREQFMNLIKEESPAWAEALDKKAISFERIMSWKPEVILEIMASVNILTFSVALKSLTPEQLEAFMQTLSHQDKRRLEAAFVEKNPTPNEISTSVMKVIGETRLLLVQGSIKADRIDPDLVIPDEFESSLGKSKSANEPQTTLMFDLPPSVASGGATAVNNGQVEQLQKRLVLLSKEVQSLRTENQLMKDKLEKIKKIA